MGARGFVMHKASRASEVSAPRSVRKSVESLHAGMKIAVVGAGVIGVTSAIAVQEALPKSRVTIYADVLTPATTGDGSAGLWGPFILGDTPEADVIRWAGISHRWFEKFWRSGLAPDTGVSLIPVVRVTSKEGWTMPAWSRIVYGAEKLNDRDLRRWNDEHRSNYKSGLRFLTWTVEPTLLLPWLMNKFTSAGGIVRNTRIDSLEALAENGYETVINCSGLGARRLTNDSSLVAVRGQVTRVKAPWAYSVFLEEDNPGNYIIPNIHNVVLGGTGQEGDYDLGIRDTDTKFVRDGCLKILPALEGCDVIKHWVGLRPKRSQVRIESELCSTSNGNKFTVIHNYGHGGAGVTISWGCALDVVEILKKANDKNVEISSKL